MDKIRRKNRSRLIDNISSDFFAAASRMKRADRIMVYVEGYEDIAFWRSVLDEWETDGRKFEITTPVRGDMAKGKKVVLSFAQQSGKNLLLCVDSDFDYLFADHNEQSRLVNNTKYLVQTYTYAIENLLCYPPSLDSIAVRATKNDSKIFDFEHFMTTYSQTIYPLFLWYIYAAYSNNPGVFPLSDFKGSVRLNYLEIDNDGEGTIEWLDRQVRKRLSQLENKYPEHRDSVARIEQMLQQRGVTPQTTHYYMQGHCLMDNVVKIVLSTVCDALRKQWIDRINASRIDGLTLRNELSSYNNTLRDIDSLLSDNIGYRRSEQFARIKKRLEEIYPTKI